MKKLFKERLAKTSPVTADVVERLQDKTYFNGEKIQAGDVMLFAMLIGDVISNNGTYPELPMKVITLNEKHFHLFEPYHTQQKGLPLPVIQLIQSEKTPTNEPEITSKNEEILAKHSVRYGNTKDNTRAIVLATEALNAMNECAQRAFELGGKSTSKEKIMKRSEENAELIKDAFIVYCAKRFENDPTIQNMINDIRYLESKKQQAINPKNIKSQTIQHKELDADTIRTILSDDVLYQRSELHGTSIGYGNNQINRNIDRITSFEIGFFYAKNLMLNHLEPKENE